MIQEKIAKEQEERQKRRKASLMYTLISYLYLRRNRMRVRSEIVNKGYSHHKVSSRLKLV